MRVWLCAITLALGACNRVNPEFGDEEGTGTGSADTSGGDTGGGDDAAEDGSGSGGGDTGSGADGSGVTGVDDGGTTDGPGSDATGDGDATGGTSGNTSGDGSSSEGSSTTSGADTSTTGGLDDTGTTTGGSASDSGTTGAVDEFCDDSDASVLACYQFENVNGGQAFDGSMFDNHGAATMVGLAPGVSGNAGDFSSSSQVVVPNDATLNPTDQITIEGWIYLDQIPTDPDAAGIVHKEGQWYFHVTSISKINCNFSGIGGLTGGMVYTGQWHHVACLYDGDRVRMYQDGQPRGMVGTPRSLWTSTNPLYISNTGAGFEPLIGRIDNLRIWKRGLSPEEICTLAGQVGC